MMTISWYEEANRMLGGTVQGGASSALQLSISANKSESVGNRGQYTLNDFFNSHVSRCNDLNPCRLITFKDIC